MELKNETKCNFCDQIFPNESEFLTHRKKYHIQFVPPCRNLPNGECNYTNKNCWFNHKENLMINENENNENEIEGNREVIQKIFEMMENFTKEITQLKEINNLQQNTKKESNKMN
jgi:DNA repair exonuclease SbcCD ATPase subunit